MTGVLCTVCGAQVYFSRDCEWLFMEVCDYGWPSYSQLIIFTSSKNIFTGSRNKSLAKATQNWIFLLVVKIFLLVVKIISLVVKLI